MSQWLRYLFYFAVVWPVVTIVLGFNVRRRSLIPHEGPAIIVSNHNSHLDTAVLVTLFPVASLPHVRPVAAADYFLANKWVSWFSNNIVKIVPINRKRSGNKEDVLESVKESLRNNDILLMFPEGTRGQPEELSELKRGIAHIAEEFPDVPIIPIYMHGLGKALPRGEALLVPFFIDVFVGRYLFWNDSKEAFMTQLSDEMHNLSNECNAPEWT